MMPKPLMRHLWARNSRLWHALPNVKSDSLCGKRVPEPRMTLEMMTPEDDVRYAKCDRILWDAKGKSGN